MSNTTQYFFGAYLEIETVPVEAKEFRLRCANGHDCKAQYSFCPKCAAQVSLRELIFTRNQTLYELLEGDEQLTSITPPSLYGKKILAIANTTRAGHWLVTGRGYDKEEVLDFPTDAEIVSLKAQLSETYADTITHLRQLPSVKSVIVRAGYVLDQEY